MPPDAHTTTATHHPNSDFNHPDGRLEGSPATLDSCRARAHLVRAHTALPLRPHLQQRVYNSFLRSAQALITPPLPRPGCTLACSARRTAVTWHAQKRVCVPPRVSTARAHNYLHKHVVHCVLREVLNHLTLGVDERINLYRLDNVIAGHTHLRTAHPVAEDRHLGVGAGPTFTIPAPVSEVSTRESIMLLKPVISFLIIGARRDPSFMTNRPSSRKFA